MYKESKKAIKHEFKATKVENDNCKELQGDNK